MNLERFEFLGISRNFSASIGSFQGLPAELSEVILLSQRLALKYNTTPPGSCQHFLTSFFQFLCGGVNSLSQSLTALPAPSGREPLARRYSFRLKGKIARPGGYPFRHRLRRCHLPQGDGFSGGGKLCGSAKRRPLGGAGCERSEQTEGVQCQKLPLRGSWRAAPERVQPYIITLYRQSKSQPGIDGGLYYPPESALRCQDFPCKILSRKISTFFGDCYKTQNIVVFCLTCH